MYSLCTVFLGSEVILCMNLELISQQALHDTWDMPASGTSPSICLGHARSSDRPFHIFSEYSGQARFWDMPFRMLGTGPLLGHALLSLFKFYIFCDRPMHLDHVGTVCRAPLHRLRNMLVLTRTWVVEWWHYCFGKCARSFPHSLTSMCKTHR